MSERERERRRFRVRVLLDGRERRLAMRLPRYHWCAQGEPFPRMRGRALSVGPVTIEVMWAARGAAR